MRYVLCYNLAMRILLIFSLVFSLINIGYVDIAHAGDRNPLCLEHLHDTDGVNSTTYKHDGECNLCYCGHGQAIGNILTLSIPLYARSAQQNPLHDIDHFRSAYLSGLYRPPRF